MKDLLGTKDARLKKMESKVAQLETLELKVQKQEEKIAALRQQIDKRLAIPSQFAIHPSSAKNSNDTKPVAAAAIPKSCADLRYFGQTVNGLYLIMGTEKVETVSCDFSLIPSDPSKITFQVFTSHSQIHKLINKNQLN